MKVHVCNVAMINKLSFTHKAPIKTTIDDKFYDIYHNLRKKGMIFHENYLHQNRLLADDSQDICLICYFLKKAAKFEIVSCCKLRPLFHVYLNDFEFHTF